MKRLLTLLPAILCAACTPTAERQLAAAAEFWATTDWSDPQLGEDPAQLETRFAEYVALLEDPRLTPAQTGPLLRQTLTQAADHETAFLLLRELSEKYLYSPESPLRDDELYLHALEPVIGSPYLSDYEKLRPRYQQNMARRNRPGMPATDFAYTLADGRIGRLHALDAEYTLLFFTDPACPACAKAIRQLRQNRTLRRFERSGRLHVLALYSHPDEEIEAWRSHLDAYPASWIAAYDAGAALHYEGLYDLRHIPCFYLLDARKRVLVKGAADVRRIAEALRRTNIHTNSDNR
ncbi:MAG: DUF5106 domain-containing protein [Alistipes sp.]|nr:DUF5106 domain-containing protein [Alistipes senegalensis]MCM1249631.1 DUF5106 domain-containing protein [Alistipes sp.]